MQAAEPQAVLTPITEAAIFLTVTVELGAEYAVHDVLADVSGLRRSVGGLRRSRPRARRGRGGLAAPPPPLAPRFLSQAAGCRRARVPSSPCARPARLTARASAVSTARTLIR
jgi:hypothetical protein